MLLAAKGKSAYNRTFYDRYQDYLQEPTVRANHDMVFTYFRQFTGAEPLRVADLGCAVGEYLRYGSHSEYVGIDLNRTGQVKNFIQADYRDPSFVSRLPFAPNTAVSLFSVEPVLPAKERYALYEALFAAIPTLKYILTSGFFYESKRDQETVTETGGVTSHQTVEDQARHISPNFSEFRLSIRTPSKMFGYDVVEVWKILVRNESKLRK